MTAPQSDQSASAATWSVYVRIRLAAPGVQELLPSMYDAICDVLARHGPVLDRPSGETVGIHFGVQAADVAAAQFNAGGLAQQVASVLGPGNTLEAIQLWRARGAGESAEALPSCVGVGEAAMILGVSKQRIHQLSRRADFPAPVLMLKATPVWREADIRYFGDHRKPSGRPLKIVKAPAEAGATSPSDGDVEDTG